MSQLYHKNKLSNLNDDMLKRRRNSIFDDDSKDPFANADLGDKPDMEEDDAMKKKMKEMGLDRY